MRRTRLIAIALLLISPFTVKADVIYEFEAFSSFEFTGESILSGGFSVITSDFVTTDTLFDLADLEYCFVISSLGTNQCGSTSGFRFDIAPDAVTIQFGAILGGTDWGVFYYFEEGAFGAVGTYATVVFGEDQAGELRVSVVPEPGALALFGIGLVGMGLVRRRKL